MSGGLLSCLSFFSRRLSPFHLTVTEAVVVHTVPAVACYCSLSEVRYPAESQRLAHVCGLSLPPRVHVTGLPICVLEQQCLPLPPLCVNCAHVPLIKKEQPFQGSQCGMAFVVCVDLLCPCKRSHCTKWTSRLI